MLPVSSTAKLGIGERGPKGVHGVGPVWGHVIWGGVAPVGVL